MYSFRHIGTYVLQSGLERGSQTSILTAAFGICRAFYPGREIFTKVCPAIAEIMQLTDIQAAK